jgi:SET domain-containing protein
MSALQLTNRSFLSTRLVNQEVGRGVFATENICAGTYLLEYAGVRTVGADPDDLVVASHRQINYLFEFHAEDGDVDVTYIDARLCGNESRFINYYRGIGAEANVYFEQVSGHALLFAQTDIAHGDQLLLDYVRSYIHTHIHAHRHTHTHTYTHILIVSTTPHIGSKLRNYGVPTQEGFEADCNNFVEKGAQADDDSWQDGWRTGEMWAREATHSMQGVWWGWRLRAREATHSMQGVWRGWHL